MNQKQHAAWVQGLANAQMKRWKEINPLWVENMPGMGEKSSYIQHPSNPGVAGEDYQPPSPGTPLAILGETQTASSNKWLMLAAIGGAYLLLRRK